MVRELFSSIATKGKGETDLKCPKCGSMNTVKIEEETKDFPAEYRCLNCEKDWVDDKEKVMLT